MNSLGSHMLTSVQYNKENGMVTIWNLWSLYQIWSR